MFDVVRFFDDVRITLYFDIFELSMEITLKLRVFLLVIVTYFYYVTITLFFCSI